MSDRPAAASRATPEGGGIGAVAARLADWLAGYFTQVFAVADTEVRKLRHDPNEILTRALQPVIWLLLFGQVMAHVRGLDAGGGTTSISWHPAYSRRACCSPPSSTASRRSGSATSASCTATS